MNRGLTYGLCLRTPVGCEPVSAPNSLLTGKLTGNLPISGVSAANLTTSLRACARPDRAAWAACRRRRGDRITVLCCCNANVRFWHKADLRNDLLFVRFRGEADMHDHVALTTPVADDPKRTLSGHFCCDARPLKALQEARF